MDADHRRNDQVAVKGKPMTDKQRKLCAVGGIFLGAVFMIIGVLRGEHETVFRKAIMICLECIGIG